MELLRRYRSISELVRSPANGIRISVDQATELPGLRKLPGTAAADGTFDVEGTLDLPGDYVVAGVGSSEGACTKAQK